MIAFIEGKILKKSPDCVIIFTNGIGYEIFTPLSSYNNLKNEGEIDSLYIYTFYKEDNLKLFGFKSELEREIFKLLLTASGVGPKLALTILSNIDVKTLQEAILTQNAKLLTNIGGIGLKRAEKLIFELKERFKNFYHPELEKTDNIKYLQIKNDAIIALENLGYNRKEIIEAIQNINISNEITLEEFIKEALKKLSKL